MKKLLLACALGAAAFGIQAQDFSTYFTLQYEGKEIKSGDTIIVNKGEDDGYEFSYQEVVIHVINNESEIRAIYGDLNAYTPSFEEFRGNWAKWGNVSLCYAHTAEGFSNCLGQLPGTQSYGNGFVNVGAAGHTPIFEWQVHRSTEGDPSEVSEFVLTIVAMSGETSENGSDVEETEGVATINIKYGTELNAVSTLEATAGEAEYYSLDGRRLTAPAGLCIEKRGGKVSKRIVR